MPRASAERLERGCPPGSGGQLDDRRLEVVADGLPLFHGAQLAIVLTRAEGQS